MILPHGVLFRGNKEAEIRKNIVERDYIKGIIGLPPNLFYGTGISACIIVLDKENADNREGIFIFMIDANNGFYKDGNKNRLRERDIHQIVDVFTKLIEIPTYSRMVPFSEIEKNDYNLNIPRYISTQEDEDFQDIEAHLKGNIPNKDIDNLALYWKVFPDTKRVLFSPSQRVGYLVLKVNHSEIKSSIFDHPEFKTYSKAVDEVFSNWKTNNLPSLNGIAAGTKSKENILIISESLLKEFLLVTT